MKFKKYIVPVFVPHQGCPHDCVFCNQKNITGHKDEKTLADVEEMIDAYLEDIHQKQHDKIVEIAFYGGSFTGIEVSLQKAYLQLAYKKKQAGLIDGIRLSTRPDYIDEEIIETLKAYGVTTIELGVQSLNEKVLFMSNRGHTIADVIRACNLIKAAGFKLGLQVMVGLPGDDGFASCDTADKVILLKPDFVRIYPTLVIRDTDLEALLKAGVYKPLTLEEAVGITVTVYRKFLESNIKVIRIGLQPTDDLNQGASLVDGPYHPSFRQMVEAALYREAIGEVLEEYDMIKRLTICVNKKEVSNVVGLNRSNLAYFEALYKLKKISVFSEELEIGEIKLMINDKVVIMKKF